ncbi:MAG: hypothetical protein ACR2KG_03370 [Nocardioidaceae bacterium]
MSPGWLCILLGAGLIAIALIIRATNVYSVPEAVVVGIFFYAGALATLIGAAAEGVKLALKTDRSLKSH